MKTIRIYRVVVAAFFVTFAFASPAFADYVGSILGSEEDVKSGIEAKGKKPLKEAGYSPYAGKNYPAKVFWGDTHLHTNLSLDARAFGVTLGPEEAYRFARGDEITTTHGERIKLSRPLDWLVVSDHSDAMGAMDEVVKGNPTLLKDAVWDVCLTEIRGRLLQF